MLSGAFLLSNQNNIDYKSFYKKTYKKIIKPALIFYALYFITSLALDVREIAVNGASYSLLLSTLMQLIIGTPAPHLWTTTVLIGIYLLTPFILKFKDILGDNKFLKFTLIYFIWACFSGNTSYNTIYWSIGTIFCYLGYFLIGYQIRIHSKKDTKKALLSFIFALVFLLLALRLQYSHTLMGLAEYMEDYQIIDSFNPLIVLASLSIFYGFSCISINLNVYKISKYTFYIYLIHAGIVKVVSLIIDKMITLQVLIYIPIVSFITLVISLVISVVLNKVLS